jgi:hypothetical protein
MNDIPKQRIGLVGCVKQKVATPAPAVALYTSTLFRGRVAYVEHSCDRWFVLSALHGLVEPLTILEPYDESLDRASRARRRSWSRWVLTQLRETLGDLGAYRFEIHAGAPYRDFGLIAGLEATGAPVTIPASGLRFGNQLAFYSNSMA